MNTSDKYPKFIDISLDDLKLIQQKTHAFDTYSDFNIISLFAWNTQNNAKYSFLNNNLVICLPDYITNHSLVSILGTTDIDTSIQTLLSTEKKLSLVPSIVVDHIQNRSGLLIEEDFDNFDYIYSLQKLSTLEGHEYKSKRKRLKKIEREYGANITFTSIKSNYARGCERVIDIFDKWAGDKDKQDDDITNERIAILRVMKNLEVLSNITVTICTYSSEDIGFSINEYIPGEETATCHFQKMIISHQNFDILLTNKVSKQLSDAGAKYVNWEQDLGIPGLRSFKESYHPVRMLKKFEISYK